MGNRETAAVEKFVTFAKSPDQMDGNNSSGGQVTLACEHMTRELLEGYRHGYFEMTITVERIQSDKRRIVIKAGKTHQFIA